MSAVKNAEGTQKLSVFKMTWPIFIEILLQMMVGNVDQFMLSHYSQHSVAAVGNANQIMATAKKLPKSAPLPCLPIWFSALSSARRCLFLTVSF